MGNTLADRGLSRSDIQKRAIDAARKTGRLGAAARAAGVHRDTLWLYRKEDPELDKALREALDDGVRRQLNDGQDIAADLVEAARTGDKDARREALDWLSRLTLPLAKARLPEYKREQPAGNTSIALNMYVSALIAPPGEAVDQPVTIEAEKGEAKALDAPDNGAETAK